MIDITAADPQSPPRSIETTYSWVVAGAALVAMALAFGGPWLTVVGLKAIAADVGGQRSTPALASSLAWFGSAIGGLAMGPIAMRYGIRWTVIPGGVMVALGLAISTLGGAWQLWAGHGIFMGLLGIAGLNAPLYIYVARWFDRRRGSALALISSGSYIAGAIWPTIFERGIAIYGWKTTMLSYGVIEVAVVVPLAAKFFRAPPEHHEDAKAATASNASTSVFGWRANLVFGLIAAAAFLCCVPMAMPQGHLAAFCTDLGIAPTRGAMMLSLVLGIGFVSRQLWGWVSDRFGGLNTVITGSAIQAVAMVVLLFTQDEAGLFLVAGIYGLGFSGIIPAYVLAVRELFPASEAGWRIPAVLLFSGSGMAAGGWLAGLLYDRFGFYAPAFGAGVAFNIFNLIVVATLVLRQRSYKLV